MNDDVGFRFRQQLVLVSVCLALSRRTRAMTCAIAAALLSMSSFVNEQPVATGLPAAVPFVIRGSAKQQELAAKYIPTTKLRLKWQELDAPSNARHRREIRRRRKWCCRGRFEALMS